MPFLGGYSDHYGRKWPLLLGMLSVLVDNSFYMLVWSDKVDLNLEWLYVSASLSGLLGDFLLLMSCVNAYLSDQFGNKREVGNLGPRRFFFGEYRGAFSFN